MNPRETLVTVVIPAFNAEDTIGDAIDSVLAQRHRNLELIVVDDGSTDRTAKVARRRLDDRVMVMSVTNGGVSRARNIGLARARGEYIAFLDADDYWLASRLDRQVEILGSNPSVEVVGHLMRYESLESERVIGITGEVIDQSGMTRIREGRFVPFPMSAALFRTRSVETEGGFDEQLPAAEDLDLFAQLACKGSFVTIDDVLGAYRIHGNSVSATKFSTLRKMARFVRARLAARSEGHDLTLPEFEAAYRPTIAQRHDDLVHRFYRDAGLAVAERRWLRAVIYGAGAMILGPRYTTKRVLMQRSRR